MERLIELDGCLNFRDLGGYPALNGRSVRWRRLFRSDALHFVTPADVIRLRDTLGIGEVIDLRSTPELQADGQGPLAAEPIRFHHLPLYDGDTVGEAEHAAAYSLADHYFLLAELAKRQIAEVIRVIAAASSPAVYHCAAGKDRTGVVSAVLLSIVGVKEEIIVADYAATQRNLDAIIERLLTREGYQEMLSVLPPDTVHAEPETMISFLDRMRKKYGSMRGYARSAGVSAESLQRLEARLLTEEDNAG